MVNRHAAHMLMSRAKHSGPLKLRAPSDASPESLDLHNPRLKSGGDKLLGRGCEPVAVSSFVPEACRARVLWANIKAQTGLIMAERACRGTAACTHTHLNKRGKEEKNSRDNLSQSV